MMSESQQLPHLKTDRLLLRPFELSDAKSVQTLAGDNKIAPFYFSILSIPFEPDLKVNDEK